MLHRLLPAAALLASMALPAAAAVFVIADLPQERDIRSELYFAGTRGPVTTVIRGQAEANTPAAALATVGQWSQNGRIRFAADTGNNVADGYFVVFVFNQSQRIQGEVLCSGKYTPQLAPPGPAFNLSAAFCLRDFPLTSAFGYNHSPGSNSTERLVSAVSTVLFPRGLQRTASAEQM